MVYFDGETILVTMQHSNMVDHGWLWLTMVDHDWYYKPKGIVKPTYLHYKSKWIKTQGINTKTPRDYEHKEIILNPFD